MPLSLVTGGSGFIGSHVVDEMVRVGHKVRVLDQGVEPHRKDVEFSDADLRDAAAVAKAAEGCDYVFHLGAVANVNQALLDPALCVQVNVLGTVNVLEAALRHKVKRVVLGSTVWVYSGSPEASLREGSPFYVPKAGPFYSSSKIASELFCHEYWGAFQQPFTILRYGTPYGPRMREPLVLHSFISKALAGEPISVTGDGSQFRRFVFAEDLARAHPLALREEAANQTYNLEGSQKVSIMEAAEAVAQVTGKEVVIQYGEGRLGDDRGIGVSIAKAWEELGWEPRVDFHEGLRRTIQWYLENAPG